jgi:hypothetical protein
MVFSCIERNGQVDLSSLYLPRCLGCFVREVLPSLAVRRVKVWAALLATIFLPTSIFNSRYGPVHFNPAYPYNANDD